MYPYFYPSYFSQPMMGTPKMAPGMQNIPAQPMQPMQGVPPVQNVPMPSMQTLPPVPGKTAGLPVESVPPAPVTMVGSPVDLQQEEGPPVTTDVDYIQGFLRTQIGKRVKVEFLIGTNSTTDRIGTLVKVGISYVLLQLVETDDLLMADLYAIKFVTIYQ